MNKVINDYFDLSVTDKLKELEKKIDNIDKNIEHKFKDNKFSLNILEQEYEKINEINNSNNNLGEFCKTMDNRLNNLEDLFRNMENRISDMDNKINLINDNFEIITTKLSELKQPTEKKISTLEYHRWLNSSIRTQIPVSFYTSKAIDDLNKISNNKKTYQ